MASRILEYLMQNAGHTNRQIFKNKIIKTLVECWRNKLDSTVEFICIGKLVEFDCGILL